MTAIGTQAGVGYVRLRRAVLSRAVKPRAVVRVTSGVLQKTQQRHSSHLRVAAVGSAGATVRTNATVPRSATHKAYPQTQEATRSSHIAHGYGGVYGRGPERGGGGGMVPVPDRCVALLPYLVPLLDGLRYSRFFFQQFPSTIFLLQPLQPLAAAYYSIPFASLVSFFAIYLGLAENKNMSRFVRFNAMQAIIVDVCMVLPGMVEYGTALGVSQIRRHCLQPLYSECNK